MEYKKGDFVIYGIHGRCEVTGIQKKVLNQQEELFYELTPILSSKKNSRFLIPVKNAGQTGLRSEVSEEEIPTLLDVLSSSEFFIKMDCPWPEKEKEIQYLIRHQGALGLTKVVRHLYIYHEMNKCPEPIATKNYRNFFKILAREIAQVKNISIKHVEVLIMKALTNKAKKTN